MNPLPSDLPRKSFWQKLGGTSLSISVLFHIVLLVAGLIWVFQVTQPEEKKVIFLPPTGGGSPSVQTKSEKQRVQLTKQTLSRVVAIDSVNTTIALPEPEEVTKLVSLDAPAAGSLSHGQGGTGSGGVVGAGDGPGTFAGMVAGTGDKNPFGMVNPDKGSLVGTFYDLKQTTNRAPTHMTDDEMRVAMREITRRGFKDKVFEKYFKAPRVLYQSKIHIPLMAAESAPAAFECEKEVQPKRWVVVYRGAVQAPHSGRFRFVGAGDDLLVVRFNNRPVFDYGYTLASTGTHLFNRGADLAGTTKNPEFAKEVRRLSPMRIPVTFYKYESMPNTNQNIGGVAVGPVFEVKEGQTYPIEILIGEIPGGYFSVSLLIEEVGANYRKDPAGYPILPLFRVDSSLPSPDLKGEAPPFDPDGPVWKSVPGAGKPDI